jgi:hypothetical protein
VRMDLLVVLAACAAEKVKDRLSVVRTAHALSLRNWRIVVKRNFICPAWMSVLRLTPAPPFKYGPTYA